jgi:hypothetical protein
MNPYLLNFLYILLAALISSVLGGLFGAAIAWLSPEFVASLFQSKTGDLARYAAAVGAVWGLFIGAGAMAFAIGAAAVAHRLQSNPEEKA